MALVGKHRQPELEEIAKSFGFYAHKTGQYDVIFKANQANTTVTWYFTKGTVLVQPGNKSLKQCNIEQFKNAMQESMRHPFRNQSDKYEDKRRAPESGRDVLREAFRFNNASSSTEPPMRSAVRPANTAGLEYGMQKATTDDLAICANTNKIKYEQLTEEQKDVARDVMSGRNVFITGPAGTGKSFLFKYLIQELSDHHGRNSVAVTASTGIAAVNVDGVTIHSFAGIMLGKGEKEELLQKLSVKARKNWMKTKVLMIDEISMLGSQLFTKLAYIGAVVKNCNIPIDAKAYIPFGGIQVVLCGDFFQLPPVKLGTKDVGTFAFESPDWKKLDIKMCHLDQIQRQKDSQFTYLLNKVRRGNIDHSDIDLLETCHTTKKQVPKDGIIPTKLMCINKDVDVENNQKLRELGGEEIKLPARDEIVYTISEYSEETLKKHIEQKAPGMLILKEEAQVVLTRNLDVGKKLVNGSRGVVMGFEEETFHPDRKSGEKISGTFLCPIIKWDCGVTQLLHPFEFGYHNPTVGKILRVQFPLKLAWSLTVHKSQGMTISRAEITVGNAFEKGQVYVALSRCVSLDGLWMSGERLSPEAVMAHDKVKEYYNQGGKEESGIKNESLKPSGSKRQASSDGGYDESQWPPKMERNDSASVGMGYGASQWPPEMEGMDRAFGSGNSTVNEEGFTEVYTDGACPDNGRDGARAGVGVWWGHGHNLNVAQPVARSKQTNNAAEIQAASIAIQQAVDSGVKKLLINTDSKFLIDCVTKWMSNWKKNGWMTSSRNPVQNKEDLEELDKAMNSGNIQVKWNHVKGHAGIEGNEEADKLAVRGAYMQT